MHVEGGASPLNPSGASPLHLTSVATLDPLRSGINAEAMPRERLVVQRKNGSVADLAPASLGGSETARGVERDGGN